MQKYNTELLITMVREQFKKNMHETDPDKIQKMKDEWVRFSFLWTIYKIMLFNNHYMNWAWGLIGFMNLCCFCYPWLILAYVVCSATVLLEDWSTICYTSLKICRGENSAKALDSDQGWISGVLCSLGNCFCVWFDFLRAKNGVTFEKCGKGFLDLLWHHYVG